jgi:hypothetical protein
MNYPALYHRLLHGHAALNDRFARDVIAMALAGIQPVPRDRTRSDPASH